MSELTFTCNRPLRDVIDLQAKKKICVFMATCQNNLVRSVNINFFFLLSTNFRNFASKNYGRIIADKKGWGRWLKNRVGQVTVNTHFFYLALYVRLTFTCQNRHLLDAIDLYISELTFTCQNKHLCDLIDLYMSELTVTCWNKHLRDVIVLYMSELTFTCQNRY